MPPRHAPCWVATLACAGVVGCSASHAPRASDDFDGGTDARVDAARFVSSCPKAEADGELCACVDLEATTTNSIWVCLDGSSSMSDPFEDTTKWDFLRRALFDAGGAFRPVGSRLALGASVFPATSGRCDVGEEILPITLGGEDTYDELTQLLVARTPGGGSPLAASLEVIAHGLSGRAGALVLVTDGGPNCGTTPCSPDACEYDIEGFTSVEGVRCAPPVNCCDPTRFSGGGGWLACDDLNATLAAVGTLADIGIATVVVGAPSHDTYASDLDAIAYAGGAPNSRGPHGYYDLADAAGLKAMARSLGGTVANNCHFPLDRFVSDPGVTTVFIDGELVPEDSANGWSWIGPQLIVFSGDACDRAQSGVGSIQIAVACKGVAK